jgi:hypothetical protein
MGELVGVIFIVVITWLYVRAENRAQAAEVKAKLETSRAQLLAAALNEGPAKE